MILPFLGLLLVLTSAVPASATGVPKDSEKNLAGRFRAAGSQALLCNVRCSRFSTAARNHLRGADIQAACRSFNQYVACYTQLVQGCTTDVQGCPSCERRNPVNIEDTTFFIMFEPLCWNYGLPTGLPAARNNTLSTSPSALADEKKCEPNILSDTEQCTRTIWQAYSGRRFGRTSTAICAYSTILKYCVNAALRDRSCSMEDLMKTKSGGLFGHRFATLSTNCKTRRDSCSGNLETEVNRYCALRGQHSAKLLAEQRVSSFCSSFTHYQQCADHVVAKEGCPPTSDGKRNYGKAFASLEKEYVSKCQKRKTRSTPRTSRVKKFTVIWKAPENESAPCYKVVAPLHKFRVRRPSKDYYETETKPVLSEVTRNQYKIRKNACFLEVEEVKKAKQIVSSSGKKNINKSWWPDALLPLVEASTAPVGTEVANEGETPRKYEANVTQVTTIGFPNMAPDSQHLSNILSPSTDEVQTTSEANAAVPGAVWEHIDTDVTVAVPEEPLTVRHPTVDEKNESTTSEDSAIVAFDEGTAVYIHSAEANPSGTSDDINIAVFDESTAGYADITAKNPMEMNKADSMAVPDRKSTGPGGDIPETSLLSPNNEASKREKKLVGIKDTRPQTEPDHPSPARPTLAHGISASALMITAIAKMANEFGGGTPSVASKTTHLPSVAETQTRVNGSSRQGILSNTNTEYTTKMFTSPEHEKNAPSMKRQIIAKVRTEVRVTKTTLVPNELQKPPVRTEEFQLKTRVDLNCTDEAYSKEIPVIHEHIRDEQKVSPRERTTLERSTVSSTTLETKPSRGTNRPTIVTVVYRLRGRTPLNARKNEYVKEISVRHDYGKLKDNERTMAAKNITGEGSVSPNTSQMSEHAAGIRPSKVPQKSPIRTEVYRLKNRVDLNSTGKEYYEDLIIFYNYTQYVETVSLADSVALGRNKRRRGSVTAVPSRETKKPSFVTAVHHLHRRTTCNDVKDGYVMQISVSSATSRGVRTTAATSTTPFSELLARTSRNAPSEMHRNASENSEINVWNDSRQDIKMIGAIRELSGSESGELLRASEKSQRLLGRDLHSNDRRKRQTGKPTATQSTTDVQQSNNHFRQAPETTPLMRNILEQRGPERNALGLSGDLPEGEKPSSLKGSKASFIEQSAGARGSDTEGSVLRQRPDKVTLLESAEVVGKRKALHVPLRSKASSVLRAFVEGHHKNKAGLERRVRAKKRCIGCRGLPNYERDGRPEESRTVLDAEPSTYGEHRHKNVPAKATKTRTEVISIRKCNISKLERYLEVCQAIYLKVELAIQAGFKDEGCRLIRSYIKCVHSLLISYQCPVYTLGQAEEGRNYRKAKEKLKYTCHRRFIELQLPGTRIGLPVRL